jgi:glycine/D-amino acid oxidase-like deaminating enzyme
MTPVKRDVVVIGGGFYGCFVAYQIARKFPALSVLVLEKEPALFARASGTNQGQLHQGYMYSADVELAAECASNAARFVAHFPGAVDREVVSYFGIHRDSEIDPGGYEDFCRDLDLPLHPAPPAISGHFGPQVVASYVSAEQTFNGATLGAIIAGRMAAAKVEVRLSQNVLRVEPHGDGPHAIMLAGGETVLAGTVYNATFADINDLHARSGLDPVPIRSEVFLHFLLDLPEEFTEIGLAVIRGRFASVLPSTARAGHLLAAAAFRRMEMSEESVSLSEYVEEWQIDKTRTEAFIECAEYLPVLRRATNRGHVIGTRAAFIDAAINDTTSRVTPLLDFSGIPNYHVILGGKVTCLFEALDPALAGVRA